MLSSPGRYLALLLVCAGIALPLRSEETPPSRPTVPSKTKSSADRTSPPAPMPSADGKATDLPKMDFSSLPADAIIVVCEHTAEALRRVPDAIVLSPKKYQALRDEIDRLKKLLQSEKPVPPSKCHLKGKIENNAVLLQAEFVVVTDRANAVVTLACPQAWATSAQIKGRMPLIRAEADGFLVQIEKPGTYHVTLDLIVPLPAPTGNGRGFELTLPRAAITTLELDLPSNVKDVRVGGRPLSDWQLAGLTLKNHHLSGSPGRGAVDKLELAWKEVHPPSGVPVLIAKGDVEVRLDPTGQTTAATLTLKVEGGQTNVWRLLVPLGAEVKVLSPEDIRVKSIETANQKYASLRTIHLKEPSADPLRIQVKVHAPLPRSGSLAPVGPFFVVGAARQSGTVLVRNRVHNLHLDYHEHGDMKQGRPTEEQLNEHDTVVAAFTYGNIPVVDKPQSFSGPASLSWLDLEAEMIRRQVRTRVTHTLTLRPDSLRSERHWDIITTIAPASKWTDVEQLKVLVPPEWRRADDTNEGEQEKDAPFVIYRQSTLLREGASQPIRLEGRYESPLKAEGRAILKLPRPQGTVEQCEVTIQVPRDSEVVLHNAAQADLELVKAGATEQTWRCQRVPPDWQGIDLEWRPHRTEVRMTSVVDVTLNGGRGKVRHEIRLQPPPNVPVPIALRVPAAIGDSLKVIEGGALQAVRESSAGPPGNRRQLTPAKTEGTECRLVLEYTTELGEKGRSPRPGETFTVPLVVPEQATRGETKVRVWSEPGSLPLPAGGALWDERSIEEVKDRSELPILVLQSQRVDAPLVLRAGEQSPVFTVLVERALVRVQLLEGGGQFFRASFQLRQLAGPYLDIELPGPVPTLNLQVMLNHLKVPPDIVNESGQHTDGGSIARLRLGPDLVRQTALLELSYQLPASRSGGSPLRTMLLPPRLRGAPATVPMCWQVTVPSNRVLIAPESAAGLERTWTWRGRLLAARLNWTSADLEREFEQSLPVQLHSNSEETDREAQVTPALVCWQDAVEPITLTHAPQQAWLLVCSLGFFFLGWGLCWSARPHPGDAGRLAAWFWAILAVVMGGVAIAVLFWPTAFWAIAYGCEPGAFVLVCVIGLQWLMHQRYRRQIVFLPSFSRGRSGSSLLRKSSSHRPPPGEPSTVDAPPPSAS